MTNPRMTITAVLLVVLLTVTLASAASVWVHGTEVLRFDEGGGPVYFVLWWPPDDAQWTTLVNYFRNNMYNYVYYGVELSGIGLVAVGEIDVNTHEVLMRGLEMYFFEATPLVSTGAKCFYVYDPTNHWKTSDRYGVELKWGYIVWCNAGFISLEVYNRSISYPLWVPTAAKSDGLYYNLALVLGSIDERNPLIVSGDRFRVELPEKGTVVKWDVIFPTYFSVQEYAKAQGVGLADRLKKNDWLYRFWLVNRSYTVEVWPGSYLVVGVWPNGTVKEWRFVARRLAEIASYPPASVPRDVSKLLSLNLYNSMLYKSLKTVYYDEEIPNFNDLVGDRGNGTVVLTLSTYQPNAGYRIVLLPNGTALYVTDDYVHKLWNDFKVFVSNIIAALHSKFPVNVSKGLRIGIHPGLNEYGSLLVRNAWGYWPRGTEGTMLVIFDSGNGTYVAVIYDPVVYRNGTLVIKRYAVPSWTGCVRIGGNVIGIKYTNCSLAGFFYDEWRFDVTSLRLPWLCPTCLDWRPTFNYTYPTEFAVRVTEIEDKLDPWIEVPDTWPPQWVKREYVLAARAPTTLSPARAYAGYHVVNATRIDLWPHGWYLVVKYLEPTRSYLALVDASTTVRRLIP